jgi:hypothetical protein
MGQWIAAAGLDLEAAEDLAPGPPEGLTVTIWTARDRRISEAVREGLGARP